MMDASIDRCPFSEWDRRIRIAEMLVSDQRRRVLVLLMSERATEEAEDLLRLFEQTLSGLRCRRGHFVKIDRVLKSRFDLPVA